ncbi:hypothetical protein QFC22_004420 [Naganishia vaughanmartiniae]|uniref:Uncharacterized protein n=1 Tax=Naganishia vaughanmartiniae TaxID=1424756 RepID=A0ACC2X2F1_9TREE|nr:hypothetical protein QFC22_004420 [Naganishia vaughanmartiniae]
MISAVNATTSNGNATSTLVYDDNDSVSATATTTPSLSATVSSTPIATISTDTYLTAVTSTSSFAGTLSVSATAIPIHSSSWQALLALSSASSTSSLPHSCITSTTTRSSAHSASSATTAGTSPAAPGAKDEERPLDPEPRENSSSKDTEAKPDIDTTYPYNDDITKTYTYTYPLLTEPYRASYQWLFDAEGNQYVYDDTEEENSSSGDKKDNKNDGSFRFPPPPPSPVYVTQKKRVRGFAIGPVRGYQFEWIVNRFYRTRKLQAICPPDPTLEKMHLTIKELGDAARGIEAEYRAVDETKKAVDETQKAVNYEYGRTKRQNDKFESTIVHQEKLNKRMERDLEGIAVEEFKLRQKQFELDDLVQKYNRWLMAQLCMFVYLVLLIWKYEPRRTSVIPRSWSFIVREHFHRPDSPAPPSETETKPYFSYNGSLWRRFEAMIGVRAEVESAASPDAILRNNEQSPPSASSPPSPDVLYKGLADYVKLDTSEKAVDRAAKSLHKSIGLPASKPAASGATTSPPAATTDLKSEQTKEAPREHESPASVSTELIVWSPVVLVRPVITNKVALPSSSATEPSALSQDVPPCHIAKEEEEEYLASTISSAKAFEVVADLNATNGASKTTEQDYTTTSTTESLETEPEANVEELIPTNNVSNRVEDEICSVVEAEKAQHVVYTTSTEIAPNESEEDVSSTTNGVGVESHVSDATSSDTTSKTMREQGLARKYVSSSAEEDLHAKNSTCSNIMPNPTEGHEDSTTNSFATSASPPKALDSGDMGPKETLPKVASTPVRAFGQASEPSAPSAFDSTRTFAPVTLSTGVAFSSDVAAFVGVRDSTDAPSCAFSSKTSLIPAPGDQASSDATDTTSSLTVGDPPSTWTPQPQPPMSVFAKRSKSERKQLQKLPLPTGPGSQTSASAFGSNSPFAQPLTSATTSAAQEPINEPPHTSTSVTTTATPAATVSRSRLLNHALARINTSSATPVPRSTPVTVAPAQATSIARASVTPQSSLRRADARESQVQGSGATLQERDQVHPSVNSGSSITDFEKTMWDIARRMQGSVLVNPFTRESQMPVVPTPLDPSSSRLEVIRPSPAQSSTTAGRRLSDQEIRELEQPAAPALAPPAPLINVAQPSRVRPLTTASTNSVTQTHRRSASSNSSTPATNESTESENTNSAETRRKHRRGGAGRGAEAQRATAARWALLNAEGAAEEGQGSAATGPSDRDSRQRK